MQPSKQEMLDTLTNREYLGEIVNGIHDLRNEIIKQSLLDFMDSTLNNYQGLDGYIAHLNAMDVDPLRQEFSAYNALTRYLNSPSLENAASLQQAGAVLGFDINYDEEAYARPRP